MRCVGAISPGSEGRLQLTFNLGISSSSGGRAEPSEGSAGKEERSEKWTWPTEADQHLSYQDGGREHIIFSWWHWSLFIITWHALPWDVFSSLSPFTDGPPTQTLCPSVLLKNVPDTYYTCLIKTYLSPFSSDLRSLQLLHVPTSCPPGYEGNPLSLSVSTGGSLFSLSKLHLEHPEEVSRSVITTQDGIPGWGGGELLHPTCSGSCFVPVGRRDVQQPRLQAGSLTSLSKQEQS